MKKIFFLIFPIFFSCNDKNETNDADIKDLFVQFREGALLKSKFYLIDSVDTSTVLDWSKVDSTDTEYLKIEDEFNSEIRKTKQEIWSPGIFDSAIIIHSFDTTMDKSLYVYSLSRPIFSKNKKWCMVYYSYVSGGTGLHSCASGSMVYRKENGKWKSVYYYPETIC